MSSQLQNYRERLQEGLVKFLWRQWSALGVAGYAGSEDSWIVDPEALLLFSTTVARQDARLFDEIFDWLQINGKWISLQRIGRMRKEGLGDATILAAIAEHLVKDSVHHKWKTLLKVDPVVESPRVLFSDLPNIGKSDEIFSRWGWLRPVPDLREMSQSPRPDTAATFLFKLRSLFGRQARAEVFAWLLTHKSGHPAEIARQTGYFRRTVQLVLNELAESGHVRAFRVGREKNFSIYHKEWEFLLPQTEVCDSLTWVTWAPVFVALEKFQTVLLTPGLDERSERFQAIQFRDVLEQSLLPALDRAGLPHQFKASSDLRGSELIDVTFQDVMRLLR